MTTSPSAEERSEAIRQRIRRGQVVFADYEAQGGFLRERYLRQKRMYFPIATPGVIGAVSRLGPGDEKAVVDFAQRWGLLGYDSLTGFSSLLPRGDPLIWVWAHAAGIRTVLDLHRLLSGGDVDAVWEYLQGCRFSKEAAIAAYEADVLRVQEKVVEAHALWPRLFDAPKRRMAHKESLPGRICGFRERVVSPMFLPLEDEEDPRLTAQNFIAFIINPNLIGVYRQLLDPVSVGSLEIAYSFDSLLSVVYWHLAELVTGSRVRECDECGAPFNQRDRRQKFCPPPPGARESLCAMRSRQRRRRHPNDLGR